MSSRSRMTLEEDVLLDLLACASYSDATQPAAIARVFAEMHPELSRTELWAYMTVALEDGLMSTNVDVSEWRIHGHEPSMHTATWNSATWNSVSTVAPTPIPTPATVLRWGPTAAPSRQPTLDMDALMAIFLECVRATTNHRASSIGNAFSTRCPWLGKAQRATVYQSALESGRIDSLGTGGDLEWHLAGPTAASMGTYVAEAPNADIMATAVADFVRIVSTASSPLAATIGSAFSDLHPYMNKAQRAAVYRRALSDGLIVSRTNASGTTEWHAMPRLSHLVGAAAPPHERPAAHGREPSQQPSRGGPTLSLATHVTTNDSFACVVCLEMPRCHFFQPCGHVVCCEACSNRVQTCPACRSAIRHRLTAYL